MSPLLTVDVGDGDGKFADGDGFDAECCSLLRVREYDFRE